ncbi:MAG: phage terminase large subunit [Anaerolineae bacterium]|nr:phage terminase large subunit [Anaerolineae bacterium]
MTLATATNSPQHVTISLSRYPMQGRFVGSRAREAAFVGGIGSGKTWAGCVRALSASQGIIGKRAQIQAPNIGVITAPTYPMLRDATLRTFLDLSGPAVARFNRNEMTATMRNGSEVLFRTASEPDRLRGPSISWWFGDEAALCEYRTYEIMMGRLRQFGQLGYAWIATTPKGRNWVWQHFIQAEKPGRAIYRATSADNVYLDQAVLDIWRQTYSGDFAAQELGGEFVAFEGLIYPEFRREVHVATKLPAGFQYVIAGVDWGFANPGVVLVFGADGDGRMWQVAEHYQRQRRVEEWVGVAKQARDTWNIRTFYCDPSEPDYIRQFREAGLHAEQANNAVNTGLQAVKNRLVVQGDGRPRLTVSADCVYTIAEFESYQWAENRQGMKDQPVKANDHCMDALRYAVMGVDAGRKPIEVKTSRWA